MNELVLNIISVVVTSILIPLIVFLGAKLNTYLKQKIENDKLEGYVNNAIEAVVLSVTTVMQTYVDNLKKSGKFDLEAQKEAFSKAESQARQLITDQAKNAIIALYGDFDKWLETQIESMVKETK